jgi:hypothetical protein
MTAELEQAGQDEGGRRRLSGADADPFFLMHSMDRPPVWQAHPVPGSTWGECERAAPSAGTDAAGDDHRPLVEKFGSSA